MFKIIGISTMVAFFMFIAFLIWGSVVETSRRVDMINRGECNVSGEIREVDQGYMACFMYGTNGMCTMSMWVPNMVTQNKYVCESESFWH